MSVINYDFNSSTLEFGTNIKLILPNKEKQKDKKYKTLYLLHGYYGSNTDYINNTDVINLAAKYNIAIVLANANNSYYTNMEYGANYYDFFSDELPKHLENVFPLSSKKEDKAIFGLSMGGYGALKIAFNNPENYSACGSMSGALDIKYIVDRNLGGLREKQAIGTFGLKPKVTNNKRDLFYLSEKLSIDDFSKIFITCGTEDFLYESNIKFVNHLKKHNIDYEFYESPGGHSWDYWSYILEIAIKKLFELK